MKQNLHTTSRIITPTICHVESNNTDGRIFTYSERLVVTTVAPVVYLLLQTGDVDVTVVDQKFNSDDGELSIYFNEDAVVSAAGTATVGVSRTWNCVQSKSGSRPFPE